MVAVACDNGNVGGGGGGCTFSSANADEDKVIKSPYDKRLYRHIQLHNDLSTLLVHDPEIYHPHPSLQLQQQDGCDDEEEEEEDDDDEEEEEEKEEEEEEEEEEKEYGDDESEEDVDSNRDVHNKPVKRPKGDSSTGGDSQSKKAAAAMCVGLGSFSDPFEAQGLAHFLEHMLFMGSTGFPDENEYDSYLSKHGGSSNAFTETEHTCYHFEVKPEFLRGALMRFSQFFISPLLKTEAMEREMLAVDSEFYQVLQNDACRLQQLQCHTSASGHPFNRFFWGNRKSLVDAVEKGINLREQILKLYGNYYHGEMMKLVIIGGETLDELQSWVLELFGDVRKGPQVKPETRMEVPIWKAGKLYKLEGVKDVHVVYLSWTLPCLRKDYMKKAEDYFAHLLGHEGKGSLHFFFKARGWATSISAGVGDEGMHRSSMAYIFGISIHLTDSGLEKVYEIIGFVYQYLKLLHQVSPQEWIYRELKDIANMEFRFAEQQPQDDYAAELAENLLFYPAEHVIYGDYAYEVWDEEMIMYILGFFTPENMRVDVLSKSFSISNHFQCEPWFGSRYIEEDIPPSLMEKWRYPLEIDVSLHLPSKNEFIPQDFSLRGNYASNGLISAVFPSCIIEEPLLKFWYKLDSAFKSPRANTYFRITLKGAYDNVKSCLLTELFINLLKDELNEIVYQASVAKLETSISLSSDKLYLKIYGFNDKLPILLSNVLEKTRSFLPMEDRFKVIKEDLERTLRNTNMKPLNHSSYLRLQVLGRCFWDAEEKLNLLNDLSIYDLKSFLSQLLSQLYIEGLCHGNLFEGEVMFISNIFRSKFRVQPLPVEMRHEEHILCLPSSSNFASDVSVKNKSDTNSVVELYFQIEQEIGEESIQLRALFDIFDEIVEEPLFNRLRTQEQLGYVVECGPTITYRVFGFCFRVQSSKYNPLYLQERIDNFIDGLEKMLNELDNESFENYKSGLIAKLVEKDPSLIYETNRLWGEIVDKRYMFDLSQREADAVRNIQKSDMINWYKTYLIRSSPKCRRLAIRVWGCNTDMKEVKEAPKPIGVVIDDLAAFKASSKFYSSHSLNK